MELLSKLTARHVSRPESRRGGNGTAEELRLAVPRQLKDGTVKLVALKGRTAQDVWVVPKPGLFGV